MKRLFVLLCVFCGSMAPAITAEPPHAQSLLKDTGFGAAFTCGKKDDDGVV